jgi:formylmethanofuran dehydrogenase subunit B
VASGEEPSGDGAPSEEAALRELAGKLRRARYPVIVWAAATLPPRQADLLVGVLAGLIQQLNVTGRCAGLPLAGASNVIGVNQVCAWQTGVPLRTSFASGAPDHDPVRWSAEALLRRGLTDALLWLSALRELPLPAADSLPTVALVRAGDLPAGAAEVVIPVGVPGVDHAGSLYRTDSVVAVPVAALREPPAAPSAATVLQAIRERLDAAS